MNHPNLLQVTMIKTTVNILLSQKRKQFGTYYILKNTVYLQNSNSKRKTNF